MRINRMAMMAVVMAAVTAELAAPGAMGQANPTLITQQVDNTKLTVLKGNTINLANASHDLGEAPAALALDRMILVLKRSPEQEAAFQAFLADRADKNSPNYHHWLTPQQFGEQFGVNDQDLAAITGWLESEGFALEVVSKGRTTIQFAGTAGQVKAAFHTSIHQYEFNGGQYWANASDPSLPTALTPAVAGLASLNNFPRKSFLQSLGVVSRSKATGKIRPASNGNPLFTFPGGCLSDGNCYAVGPYDFATIYNVMPLWNAGIDGTGEKIAITGDSDINIQDVRDYRTIFGLPANDPTLILAGTDPGFNGDETEGDLDVQLSGAVAKGASVMFVYAANTITSAGVDIAAQYVIDNNLAPVLSESFGLCELQLGTAGNAFYNTLWGQAAAEGITVVISTGDSGSAVCDQYNGSAPEPATMGLAVSGFSTTPYNTALGGTDFNDFLNPATYWNTTNNSLTQASALSYIPEVAWNDSCTNEAFYTNFGNDAEANCNNPQLVGNVVTIGGTGGASNCITSDGVNQSSCAGGYPKPTWQTGTGVPADGVRDVPDVSFFASNGFFGSFYVICQADQNINGTCDVNSPYMDFVGVGGTSASTPAFAGVMAMVNQKTNSTTGQGVANPTLYTLAATVPATSCNSSATPASNCIFYDVTSGTNAMPCATGSPNCVTNVNTDLYGILSGFTNTVGFDLVTGLGTVNVANLVNNWPTSTATLATSTAVTSSNLNSPPGASVTFTAVVTPAQGGGPTLTGTVQFAADGTNLGTAVTISGGQAQISTTTLAAGTHTITATYSGDSNYLGSTGTVTQTISGPTIPTTTAVVSSNPSSPAGNSVTFTATVTPSQAGGPVLTGTVQFTSDGTDLGGPVTVSNGMAATSTTTLAQGTHTIVAAYSGDPDYAVSSGMTTQTITAASDFSLALNPTSLTVTAGGNGTTMLTVTALNGYTGTITFTNGNCSGLPSESQCTFAPVSITGTGTTALTVSTTAKSFGAPGAGSREHSGPWSTGQELSLGLLLSTLLLMGLAAKKQRWNVLAGLAVVALLSVSAACGGNSAPFNPGTPPGTYTITVTATSGTITHTTPLTLIVQ